ncbi:MAG TPA: MEDS domain-containing protein [Acidimicrobiia bacterium]|jgi:transcriptional regulator with XRE-family HTH domain|nr:MEDS domain-containing protein [Acidimicrobiia bacterium]
MDLRPAGRRLVTVASSRIGESLRTARERVGWSREALAYHSGVSWSAIAQIESGRRKDVRLSSLSALANALGVSVDYLIGTTAMMAPPKLFEHRLMTYESDDDYLESAIPYIDEGIERSHPLLVVTTEAHTALLRDTLGDRSEQVEFADSSVWYTSLHDALNGYRSYVLQKLDAGAAWIRVLGDPVWADRSDAEITAWFRYESLVNLAFAAAPATIICPYDTRRFPAEVVAEACRTHPVVADGSLAGTTSTYCSPEEFLLEPGTLRLLD